MNDDNLIEKYKRNGYPTLRSSTHVVRNARQLGCKKDPKHNQRELPTKMMQEVIYRITQEKMELYDELKAALICVLQKQECKGIIGEFKDYDSQGKHELEMFRVPMESLTPSSSAQAKKQSVQAQANLSDLIISDDRFMLAFDQFVQEMALPFMKQRLIEFGCSTNDETNHGQETTFTFYYQRPPTIRIQPGPSNRSVRTHKDADYGHQNGELNFWVPFTDINLTKTSLWTESKSHSGDYHSLDASIGEIIVFHGTSCRHFVPPNPTEYTRVSMDFRVGVKGYFDPNWCMKGTSNDHTRKQVVF